jgi:Protein of unknown function (DUF3102)
MRAQGAAPEGGTSGQRLISDGNRDIEAKELATQVDLVPHVVAEINNEHRLAGESATTAVQHAIRCGQLLTEQKAMLKHGDFGPWIERHLEFSWATACNYMKLAKNPNAVRNSLRHLYQSGQPATSKKALPNAGDNGLEDLRKSIPLQQHHSILRFRTKKQRLQALERAVETVRALPDQQHILNNYQDRREKASRLRNKLFDAEHYLFEAEDFLLWVAAQAESAP